MPPGAPIVHAKDGEVFASSRDVADFFGKLHRHVLDGIDQLIEKGVPGFRQTPWVHPQNGQTYRSFNMTKDSFTLLVMGFTGSKALEFKMAYINAFNRMEEEVKRMPPAIPDFSDPVAAARAWADETKKVGGDTKRKGLEGNGQGTTHSLSPSSSFRKTRKESPRWHSLIPLGT